MRNRLVAGLLALTLAHPTYAQGWLEEDYNPNPADGDILLPAPCGGTIAFREVLTNQTDESGKGLFADQEVWMGWGGARSSAFREGEWKGYVSGGLVRDNHRAYLIGKYEVTAGQLRAVMECTDPAQWVSDIDDGLPATSITVLEAQQFAHRYTLWLYENHHDLLPETNDGAPFARLPTEAEWEFATRGGLTVSDTLRRNERFPMDGSIDDYAWHNATSSADGAVQFIGLKRPNPLGLYDVYGNVAELVMEAFRINKAGRMHGQAGAMTIKGGAFTDPAQTLRSGTRQEMPLYSTELPGKMVRRRDVGLRLVISGSAAGDTLRSEALATGWPQLTEADDSTDEAPLDGLRQIADETSDRELRNRVNRVTNQINSELQRREELEAAALDSLLLSSAVVTQRLRGIAQNIESLRNDLKAHHLRAQLRDTDLPADASESDRIARENQELTVRRYENQLSEFGVFAEVYADALLTSLETYDRTRFVETARAKIDGLTRQGRQNLANSLAYFGVQIRDYDDSRAWDRSAVVLEMLQSSDAFTGEPEWYREAISR